MKHKGKTLGNILINKVRIILQFCVPTENQFSLDKNYLAPRKKTGLIRETMT